MNLWIILIAAILLTGLLYCEKKAFLKAKLAVKTVLSSLFIFSAVIQPHPIAAYYRLILPGLVFCLGGDVFLALPGKKMFLYGLVSFLLGHVFYGVAFFNTAEISRWTLAGLAISLIVSSGVYLVLKSHLDSMKIPVICYILVITVMVVGAWSIAGADELRSAGRLAAFAGALGFYVSDVFVARQQFLKTEIVNRLIGLPLYYIGQFLLAFSVGLIG